MQSGGIYLIQDDGTLVTMTEQPYDSEDILQHLVSRYPDLLAGEQISSTTPRRWLLMDREIGLPASEHGSGRWAVDHLLLDQDAIPTIVEVKRSSDTRIRREVVGQMLEYAANAVVYWPIATIRAHFEQGCAARVRSADEVLTEFLGDEADVDAFWQQARTNLQAGNVRLLFVADELPTELRRIIEFLNQQMSPAEVLGVEIKQYMAEGLRTLVPRVIGQTAAAQTTKETSRLPSKQWDEASFFAELAATAPPEDVQVARALLDWAYRNVTSVWWGQGKTQGSFVPILLHGAHKHQLFAVWTYNRLEISFQWYQAKPPFDAEAKRRALLARLNAIAGVSIPDEKIGHRPSVPLQVFRSTAALEELLATYDWFIQEVQAV